MAENRVGSLLVRALCCWCMLVAAVGCSRTRYRLAADRDATALLAEKSLGRPWQVPPAFSVYPHPQSRFFDPTPDDDPILPVLAPRLYAYSLPDLPERDPNRFRGEALTSVAAADCTELRITDGTVAAPEARPATPPSLVRQVAFQPPPAASPQDITSVDLEQLSLILGVKVEELQILPIPASIWESLPERCLRRMLEFASVQDEYRRSFDRDPGDELRDRSQQLALEDIVELALINSRDYQTQKERLYEAALDLTLARFDYDLKFATSGNGVNVDYTAFSPSGQSVLGIGTPLSVDQVLATGGTFLADFANDVVLTFNGANGFSTDVSSRLLSRFSQTIFQRDIVLERLTQVERNVVYEARSFARFRKTLFRDLAEQYYRLLLTYRGIEIVSQDYFSNLRGFNQSEAEYRAGRLPRFQVDQFEQSTLDSRSELIGRCNGLEESLDQLKIEIGLPPELPLNLDLTELDQLTLRDEVTAVAERVRRSRRNLITERGLATRERGALLNASVDLVRKMLLVEQLQQRLGEEASGLAALQLELAQLAAAETELEVQFNRDVLRQEQNASPAAPPLRIFQRTMDLVNSLLVLTSRQLRVADLRGLDSAAVNTIRQRTEDLSKRSDTLQADLDLIIAERELARIPEFVQTAAAMLTEADAIAGQTQALLPPQVADPNAALQQALAEADRLIAQSQELLTREAGGLAPVEVEVDEAMLTALTLRYDLMNQRESLADAWRDIKFRGDDLKSVLNLQASQQLRTRRTSGQPFKADSDTQVAITFDAPLNRRAQRNDFRKSLIDYNAGLRTLMQAEDDVKLEVRDRLRQLALDQEQYRIAVASTALAYERRISTRLQLRLGVENIRVEDVLDAQRAYTQSLNKLAGSHIDYVLDRIGLFLDLELLEVDESGVWPQLYDETYQPTPNCQLPDYALPVYGQLPHGTWPSHKIKRMLHVPPGQSIIYRSDGSQDTLGEEVPAPEPETAPTPDHEADETQIGR
ncbi:MAG: TolC family protein [Pirellulaceae bacterium]|nr:TolC family protein [Pirellulaceae bacterium]